MTTFPAHVKNCATCDYWAGQRNSNIYQKLVQVKEFTDKGKCNNLKCGFRNQQMPAGTGTSCDYYQKWGPIQ